MSEQVTYQWDDENFIDNQECDREEMKEFREMLCGGESENEEFALSITQGSVLKGKIVDVKKDFVVIDVGLKSEGTVPLTEFASEEYGIGQEVEVLLDRVEDDEGRIVLSKEKADKQRQWEHIIANCEEGSIIRGKVLYKVKGGLIVNIGIEAFLPGSQIDSKKVKNVDEYLGRTLDFKIIKINHERKNVVVSRRELLEAENLSKKIELIQQIEPGIVKKGVIKNITSFGAFINFDGVDGLLHVTDMSWKRIRDPNKIVALGDEVEVIVLSVDKERGRIALGLKQLQENPWERLAEQYSPGTKVSGHVVNIVYYGVFIEIEPGVEGLIHSSELSWAKVPADPRKLFKKGDFLEALVKDIQIEDGKISLSMREMQPNPWKGIEEKYPPGTKVKATVSNMTNYGAFVQLEEGIEGLIHISNFSWTKNISHPSEFVSKGGEIDAVILTVEEESQKMTLSIKNLEENPWVLIEQHIKQGDVINGTITKITGFGAFVDLSPCFEKVLGKDIPEGLVQVAELSNEPFGKVEEIVQVGQEVRAKVIKIDSGNKKIWLSMKACNDDNASTALKEDDIALSSETLDDDDSEE